MAQTIADTVTACYLCGQPVDGSTSSGDHVIPRTLRGKGPPKIPGFDYGGVLPTHPECNNRFGDETHVRKALQLLGALHDSNTTLIRPAPGNLKGHVLALNEQALAGLGPRDFQFFGIYDARKDSVASFDDPAYYAGNRVLISKNVLCCSFRADQECSCTLGQAASGRLTEQVEYCLCSLRRRRN